MANEGPQLSRREFLKLSALGLGALVTKGRLSGEPKEGVVAEREKLRVELLERGWKLQERIVKGETPFNVGSKETIGLSLVFDQTRQEVNESGDAWDNVATFGGSALVLVSQIVRIASKESLKKDKKQKILTDDQKKDLEKRIKLGVIGTYTGGGIVLLGQLRGIFTGREQLAEIANIEQSPEGGMRRNAEIVVFGFFDSETGWEDLNAAAQLSDNANNTVSPQEFINRNFYLMHKHIDGVVYFNERLEGQLGAAITPEERAEIINKVVTDTIMRKRFLEWTWAGKDLTREEIIKLVIQDPELEKRVLAYTPKEEDNPFRNFSEPTPTQD